MCFVIFWLAGCTRDMANPFALAPSTPYSIWTPLKGNCLVSSKYCQTLLPPSFESADLNIAELIDIALQNNPATKQTWAMARAAAAKYGQSLASFYPSMAFNGSFLRIKGSTTALNAQSLEGGLAPSAPAAAAGSATQTGVIVEQGLSTPTPFYLTQYGPDIALSYVLFDFGQRTASAIAAREALYFADLTHNQEIQIIIQTVMEDAYSYLYQQALLRANFANLENALMSLDAANERFSLGLAALGDVAQARTQYLQNKINLTSQKQNVENAFAALALDIGLPANILFKVQPIPDEIIAHPILDSIECLVEKAQIQRQDFLAAIANVRSKEALLMGAKRAVFPVVSSSFDLGHYSFQDGSQEMGPHWSAMFTLTFPIFQGFFFKNSVKNALANLERSKAELLQTELAIIQDVTISHMGVKTAASNLSDSEEYLQSAELEFQIALTGYKAGTMTILDVVSAQSSLANARAKKAESQKNWFISLANIAYATGSLCSSPNEVDQ
ncbi:MAG TPA: TolC family protein [Chlamydiales bacterium]|nr:TolC family protein [Chlamydiales bacterium]